MAFLHQIIPAIVNAMIHKVEAQYEYILLMCLQLSSYESPTAIL